MIEIELDYNVRQFIIIHLNYHTFCCSSYTRYLFYHYTYVYMYVIKLFLRSILQMPFGKDNFIIDGSL